MGEDVEEEQEKEVELGTVPAPSYSNPRGMQIRSEWVDQASLEVLDFAETSWFTHTTLCTFISVYGGTQS